MKILEYNDNINVLINMKEVVNMNNNPIGVFDSGIGGITVLKKIIEVLPNERYIYYADTENVPYGIKPKEEVCFDILLFFGLPLIFR